MNIQEWRISYNYIWTYLINESELNDLVRDLDLPKVKAELLASRLKQWNWLQSGVNVWPSFLAWKGGLYIAQMLVALWKNWGTPTDQKNETVHWFVETTSTICVAAQW